ncbi:MAG: hypothetical protein J7L15_04540 [Clostridiales bacterium]|nr:hypothetical protein [Clostridiales bacterium]
MKNMRETALYFGYGRNHFFMVRRISPEKFKYICSLHEDDFMIAYTRYLEKMDLVKLELQEIYYFLQNDRMLNKFSHYAAEHGIFKHTNHLNGYYNIVFFSLDPGFKTHPSYLKYSKLIPLFYKFAKEFSLIQ